MSWWFVRSWAQTLTTQGYMWAHTDRMIWGSSNDALVEVDAAWPRYASHVDVYAYGSGGWTLRHDLGR